MLDTHVTDLLWSAIRYNMSERLRMRNNNYQWVSDENGEKTQSAATRFSKPEKHDSSINMTCVCEIIAIWKFSRTPKTLERPRSHAVTSVSHSSSYFTGGRVYNIQRTDRETVAVAAAVMIFTFTESRQTVIITTAHTRCTLCICIIICACNNKNPHPENRFDESLCFIPLIRFILLRVLSTFKIIQGYNIGIKYDEWWSGVSGDAVMLAPRILLDFPRHRYTLF